MEIFGSDFILGAFRLSDYGMILASFDMGGSVEDNLGMSRSTVEAFLGDSPVPVYLGEGYTDKLRPQVTFVKNPKMYKGSNMYFSEKECRNIFRTLTGIQGYEWMKVINPEDEDDIWYRGKINDVHVKRVNGMVVGIVLLMECDSCLGWSNETKIHLSFLANQPIRIHSNTDDLCHYIYPHVTIKAKNPGTLRLTNKTDSYTTEIKNVKAMEEIVIDSKRELISSSLSHSLLLNDFNLHWVRLLPEENEFVVNMDAVLSFVYRVPRKAVLL